MEVLNLLVITVSVLLPAVLLGKWLPGSWSGSGRAAIALMAVILIEPLAAFSLAWLLGTLIGPSIMVASGGILALPFLVRWKWGGRGNPGN